MQKKQFYQPEFIEAFLKAQLNEADNAEMQSLINADSALKEEVDFQRIMIKMIQENRKKELKSLLQHTPIPSPTLYDNLLSHKSWLFGVAGALLLATSLYFGKDLVFTEKISQKEIAQHTMAKPQQEELRVENKIDNEAKVGAIKKSSESELVVPKKDLLKEQKNTSELVKSKKEVKPLKNQFKKEVYYQYDGRGVLQIFEDIKYELVEMEIENQKKVFLWLNDDFYELSPTGEIPQKLFERKITDEQLIQKLKEKRTSR